MCASVNAERIRCLHRPMTHTRLHGLPQRKGGGEITGVTNKRASVKGGGKKEEEGEIRAQNFIMHLPSASVAQLPNTSVVNSRTMVSLE